MSTNSLIPRYYELESFRRSVNRKLWIGMGGLLLVAVLSLGLTLIALARPLPVVVFDSRGRPVLFEDTASPRREITDIRIEYFARDFIESYVGVDSVNITDDLEKSLNMMTPALRQAVKSDRKELAGRKSYEGKNIRSFISDWKVRIGKYVPEDLNGKIYLLATGRMSFEPRFGKVDGEGQVIRWFITQLVLQRVPVTRISIHGLQAAYCHTDFFDTKEALDAHMLQKSSRP